MAQDTVQSKDDDMYLQLMAISQNALENAYYETAYHALCAAMHFANSTKDEHRLQTVAQVAKTQIDWIDAQLVVTLSNKPPLSYKLNGVCVSPNDDSRYQHFVVIKVTIAAPMIVGIQLPSENPYQLELLRC